uniref:Putative UDP galactose lipooligosaccharide galactosyltransferase n=1 Tax=uncultured organism MedDCM-OCT-S12-C71 TaxID=743666 RepID=D6PLL7_9ZZZZ|nr:putative UDP galactose lipooligosaccharide galactosyltransferase [uncultured organism MedDCM-OCT-S12-C71]
MADGKRHYTMLNVGRLVEFKDHKTLIKAFAAVVTEFPRWRLKIIGTGALRTDLDTLVESLSLNNVVKIIDRSDDIETDYANADLFVIPSRYEGFGLVTAEASSCGLPCVGFYDAPGTNSIIQDGENGVLVNHNGDKVAALASAFRQLLGNPREMRRLGKNGLFRPNWFELDTVLDHWEETIVATKDVSLH